MPLELDCATCGACCREAYDSVPVTDEDALRLAGHPEVIRLHDDGWRDLQRVAAPSGCGTWCVNLTGQGSVTNPYRCKLYDYRPTNCRDLEHWSEGCLTARERVGLPTTTG